MKIHHLNKLVLTIIYLLITGCDAETIAKVSQSLDSNTIWVFAQMNIPDEEGVESYYYYGRISEELHRQIIDGETEKGFILFRDVRYWGEDDKIYKYEDHIEAGDLLFRIEHIVKMDYEKGDPLLLEEEKYL